VTQALLPRSKPWSQFPHDPALGGQSKQCLDYILTQLNQLLSQGSVPPAQSAYSFGPDIINPTGPQFISLGGRPGSVVTAITYNAVGTQITFYWDGTNGSERLTIYRDDNTVAGPTIVGSPFVVTGLSAATRYFFYPYWDDINKVVRFVSIPNVSVGTPPVAFAAYNIKAQQIQILREHITLAAIVGTAGIVTGSGAGSAGGSGGGGGSGVAPGPGPTSSSPGGVNGDIQFNSAGVFGGENFVPLAHGGTGVDLSAAGSATAFLAESAAHVISARSIIAADVPNLDASKITSGLLALARGGTGVDLSASGGATSVLAQDAGQVISARNLVAADIPNLDVAKITTGQLALARGGTHADLSATGGASQFLRQNSVGADISVVKPNFTDLAGTLAASQMPTTFETAGIGYFCSFWGMAPPATGGGTLGLTTNKFVYATQVLYPITVRNIIFQVNTAVAASKVYIALYDSSGTLVPNSSNGGASSAAIGVISTALGTPFTINPGLYYVFIQADTTGVGLDGNGYSGAADNQLNKNVARIGSPANGISGAAVPATLGTITKVANGIIGVIFES
jgi:hypothetical protein